jgi:hypothetical protein
MRREPNQHAGNEMMRQDHFRQLPREIHPRDEASGKAQPVNDRSSEPRLAPSVVPARPLITPTVVVAAAPPQPADIRRPQPQSEPPVIRVTIGRVDVRAIASPPVPAAVSRPAARSTRLSLEDYLKERSGGRR